MENSTKADKQILQEEVAPSHQQDLHEEEPFFPILNLPNEILAKIFQYLGGTDILSLRETCNSFKSVVDELVGTHARLNDDIYDGQKLELYRKIGLQTIWFKNSGGIGQTVDEILYKKNLIEAMTFEGTMNSYFLLEALRKCKNLKMFHLYGVPDLRMWPVLKKTLKLPKLQSADIRMSYNSFELVAPFNTTNDTLTIIENLFCPMIETFCVEMTIAWPLQLSDILTCILKFINRNGMKNMKKLFICLRRQDFNPNFEEVENLLGYEYEPRLNYTITQLNQEMTLIGRKLQLQSFLVSLHMPQDPWVFFLREQKRLEKVGICDDFGFNGWANLENIAKSNFSTLKTVYIMSHFGLLDRLDFSCFQNCTGLKELLMINLNGQRQPQNPNPMTDHFINFNISRYCPNLQFFATTNVSIDRHNLSDLLNLKNLEYLALLNTGEGINLGVDFQLMKSFLLKRSLQGITVDGILAGSIEQLHQIQDILISLKEYGDSDDIGDLVLNIRDTSTSQNRRWWRSPTGFVFDIDFYAD